MDPCCAPTTADSSTATTTHSIGAGFKTQARHHGGRGGHGVALGTLAPRPLRWWVLKRVLTLGRVITPPVRSPNVSTPSACCREHFDMRSPKWLSRDYFLA